MRPFRKPDPIAADERESQRRQEGKIIAMHIADQTGPPFVLPSQPDQYGTYWLQRPHLAVGNQPERTIGSCAAVFRSGKVTCKQMAGRDKNGLPILSERYRYFASLGVRGVLADSAGLCYYDTPEEALTAINASAAITL